MSRWASRSPRSHEYNTARLGGGEVYRGRCAYGPSGSEHATTTTGEPPLRYGPERPNDAPAPRLRAGPAWRPVRDRAAPSRRDGGGPLHQVRRPRGDQAGRRRRPPGTVVGRGERPLLRVSRLHRGPEGPQRPNFAGTAFSEVAPDFISQHTIPVVIRTGLTGLAIGEGGQKTIRAKL